MKVNNNNQFFSQPLPL